MAKNELIVLKNEVMNCTKCPELVKNRTQPVFGDGNINAELMICAEAPGKSEDEKGLPFVGEAGELLNNILQACGIKREDIYLLNVLKCRPPNNRTPTDEEVSNCKGFLDRHIEIINPKYLLLLGSTASRALLGDFVSSLRGKWHEYKGTPALCSWHPSYLLRKGEGAKREAGQDFSMLLERMRKS